MKAPSGRDNDKKVLMNNIKTIFLNYNNGNRGQVWSNLRLTSKE